MEVFQHRFTALQRSFFGAALVIFALSLADCGQVLTSTPESGTFGSVYLSIKSNDCNLCHIPGGTNGGSTLDFTTQTTAFASLTSNNVTATSSSGICNGVKIVVAGSSTTSYLAAVLFSDYWSNNFAGVTGCTPYNVHHTNRSLTADEKTSILAWIQNGALNN